MWQMLLPLITTSLSLSTVRAERVNGDAQPNSYDHGDGSGGGGISWEVGDNAAEGAGGAEIDWDFDATTLQQEEASIVGREDDASAAVTPTTAGQAPHRCVPYAQANRCHGYQSRLQVRKGITPVQHGSTGFSYFRVHSAASCIH